MADQYRSFPSESVDNNLTSTGLVSVAFGFNAGFVRIENLGAGPTYVSLASTSGGTTGKHRVSSGAVFEPRMLGAGVFGLSLAASSTANVVSYGAWG